MRLRAKIVIVASAVALTASMGGVARAQTPLHPPDTSDASTYGSWTPPFVEGNVDQANWCHDDPATADDPGPNKTCVPTAGSMAILGDDDVVYWNALEDMEEVQASVVTDFGAVSVNDQSRRMYIAYNDPDKLDPTRSRWETPTPSDGNVPVDPNDPNTQHEPHPLTPLASQEAYNDAALFCAALTFLPDGRVLAAGGTTYYQDPGVPGTRAGIAELEGMANTRIYDPTHNTWTAGGKMAKGRWYPTVVPLADGKVFVASGVTKLIKPLYPKDPPTDSGRNVTATETYEPGASAWTVNHPTSDWAATHPDATADRTLPLFPRLALIPGGRVYFNSAGQVFNPMGQAYDEVTWNRTAFYNPTTRSWSDGDIPGMGTPAPGFRGSTLSVMLPLEREDGVYRTARFLTAGGIIGTTPGTYFAVTDSRIDTVTSNSTKVTSESTGSLNQPRWYGTGVLTPTGEVIAFSGASADEVDGPGTAIPVTTPELFDPETKTWHKLAPAKEKRTYHNTAALLPDGRILVGGHAPIGTMYGPPKTIVPGVTSPQETRDPTFEIYSPPYLSRGDRPVITSTALSNDTKNLEISLDPAHNHDVKSVMLMRRTAITHLVDGGQRGVLLPFTVSADGKTIHASMPNDATVLPPGPYLVFVNANTPKGPTPSVASDLMVGATGSSSAAAVLEATRGDSTMVSPDLAAAGAVHVNAELAFHEIAHSHLPAPGSPGGQDIPWPVWPALAAITVSGFWTLRHRVRSKATTTPIR